MDYKRIIKTVSRLLVIILIIFSVSRCSDNNNIKFNVFYIEFINFNDSLGNYLSSNSFGKVAFYKNNQLKILSQNFITEQTGEMHSLMSFTESDKNLKPGDKKIRVEFIGNYSVDSIQYSLQKYSYRNGQWNKISDLGVLKAVTTYKRAKEFSVREFGKQIINTVAAYTFQ